MIIRTSELAAVVSQNGTHHKSLLLVKWEYVIMNQCGGALRLFTGMKESKGIVTVCIDAGMQIDLPHAFQIAH